MTDDVAYWARQLRGALDQMGVDAAITERYNAGDVAVLNADWGREQRAHIINALEVRGFTVTSQTGDEWIMVAAPADRLAHNFVNGDGDE